MSRGPGRPIPPADLAEQWEECGQEILDATGRVLRSGRFILGEEVTSFEREFAAYLGCRETIGVASGTDALALAIQACGVGRGDEVIVPVYTFFATVEAVVRAGATPVLADVEEETANLSAQEVARRMTPRTRAVLPVHLYGTPADMDCLAGVTSGPGVALIEDACQAHGALYRSRRAGAIGKAGTFSFYPTKNLSAAGDGGAVATGDPEVADRVRLLRDHARDGHYRHSAWGMNSRLDALQAAILRAKLPRLDGWNAARRGVFARYRERCAGLPGCRILGVPAGCEPVHHLLPLLVPPDRRDAIREALAADGVGVGVHYPIPLHLQPACAGMGGRPGDFPVAEGIAARILTLPCTPSLRDEDVDRIATTIERVLACSASSS